MLDAIHLYFRYVGASMRGQMQYRASFLMMSVGHFVVTGSEFLGLWALFARFGATKGWTLHEVAMFYGLTAMAFAVAEAGARGFDIFPGMIQRGDVDRLLVRPRSLVLQIVGRELQLMRIGRFTQGLLVFLWGASHLAIAWTAPKVLLVACAVAGGACLFSGLFVITATIAFWTIESLELANCLTYGGVDAGQYPLTIYRPGFRLFFTFFVPLITINYLPIHVILGRADVLGSPAWVQWTAPAAGVAFLGVSLALWRFGVRHYCSTGS